MEDIDWKDIAMQSGVAFIAGFMTTIAATSSYDKAVIVAALLAGLRALAQAVVILLKNASPVSTGGYKKLKKTFVSRLKNAL